MSLNDSFYEDYGYGKPTISDEIIAFIFSHRSMSVHRRIIWERLKKRKKQRQEEISIMTFNQIIFRLKKGGIISTSEDILKITSEGKNIYLNKPPLLPKHLDKKLRMIIIFDIPEAKRKTRDWLRHQLRNWDFNLIQKSVWVGYGPLPKEFFEHCSIKGIIDCVKIFPVKKQLI